MTPPTTPSPPIYDWHCLLPASFVSLCGDYDIIHPEQAWVLALALSKNPELVRNTAGLTSEQLKQIVVDLTPVEMAPQQHPTHIPMPIGGAINPANLPYQVLDHRGTGEIGLDRLTNNAPAAVKPEDQADD